MVTILKYVLLGILIYIAVIPIVEEMVTVIVQGLEVIRGKMIVTLHRLQKDDKVLEKNRVIGFTLPDTDDYEEDYDEDEDES